MSTIIDDRMYEMVGKIKRILPGVAEALAAHAAGRHSSLKVSSVEF